MSIYYSSLFKAHATVCSYSAERAEVLSLVCNKVTNAQNSALIRDPSEEEIVQNFPKEKSPGLDGVTAEVLQNCWDWMKMDGCAHEF